MEPHSREPFLGVGTLIILMFSSAGDVTALRSNIYHCRHGFLFT